MKFMKKCVGVLFLMLLFFTCHGVDANASTPNQNIDVTIYRDLEVECTTDKLIGYEELFIINNSQVPISITELYVEEHNGWELVPWYTKKPADTKLIELNLDGDEILGGYNDITDYQIDAGSHAEYYPEFEHAPWNYSAESELAFTFQFTFEIVPTEFTLSLMNEDGSLYKQITALCNESVTLPQLTKEGYGFVGWKNQYGIIYTDNYVMPIGDVTLRATFGKIRAYAIYSEDDQSLTFVKTAQPLSNGGSYNGKRITKVYADVEELEEGECPEWILDGNGWEVETVIVQDEIKPKGVELWFQGLNNCSYLDLGKLNTSEITTTAYMFYRTGCGIGERTFEITGMENWDLSNVVTTEYMFHFLAWESKVIRLGDLSNWDMSNVQIMQGMFMDLGNEALEVQMEGIDNWNVGNVRDFSYTFAGCACDVRSWNFGNLGRWDVTRGESFMGMFFMAGYNSPEFYLGNLEWWTTYWAINMHNMFDSTALLAEWSLDLSGWRVYDVVAYDYFNRNTEDKVIPPKWKW